jgi:ABC-type branched-subunit amino acid transport system substrate-binding protein
MKCRQRGAVARLCAVCLVGVAALVAGCGGAGGGSGGGTLKIANFDPFSGPNADYGNLLYAGCVPAVKVIDDAGGVLGHKLTCEVVDNRGDPADAVLAARNMLGTTSNLAAIIDSDSGLVTATMPLFEQAGITDVSGAGDVSLAKSSNRYFWRTIPGDDVNGYAAAAYVKASGYTRVAAVFGNDVAAQGNVPGLLAGARSLGIQIAANQSIALDKTSYEVEVHQIIGEHPQAIVTEADPQTSAVFLSELKQAGGLVPVIGTSGTIGNDWSRAVRSAIGEADFKKYVKIVTLYAPSSGPTWQTYRTALLASSGKVPQASQYVDQVYSQSAYDDVNLIALAMVAAKSTKPADYNDQLRAVTEGSVVVHDYRSGLAALRAGKTIAYVGVTGEIKFDGHRNSPGVFGILAPGDGNRVVAKLTPAQIAAAEGGR